MSQRAQQYNSMWETFGSTKAEGLLHTKFLPTHRIGLTNFLREFWIFSLLSLNKTDTLLDAGCASGRQVFLSANHCQKAYGIDISPTFIDFANKHKTSIKSTNTDFRVGGVDAIPFVNDTFDVVICSEVIEHVLDMEKALSEIWRVTKPGGRILITVPNMNGDGTVIGRFLRALGMRRFTPIQEFSMDAIAKHGDAHVREFTLKELLKTLSDHRIEPIRYTTVSMIDGWDRLMDYALRLRLIQKALVATENTLSRLGLPLGRHIVVLCTKSTRP